MISRSAGRVASRAVGAGSSRPIASCREVSSPPAAVSDVRSAGGGGRGASHILGPTPDARCARKRVSHYLGRRSRWLPAHSAADSPADAANAPTIIFAGGGIYFFWQLGVAKYLSERFELSKVNMCGTSCGALCATLTACGVPAEETIRTAYQLSLDADLWSRPLGLAGIWGRLILKWLEDLLPEDAGELCRDRVQIMVTELPSLQQTSVDDFDSKDDLISVNMASIHIPIFLDWRLTASCREKQCVDGSLPEVVFRKRTNLVEVLNEQNSILIDHTMDERLELVDFGFLKLREYDEVLNMMSLGYDFGMKQEAAGRFVSLPMRISVEDKAM